MLYVGVDCAPLLLYVFVCVCECMFRALSVSGTHINLSKISMWGAPNSIYFHRAEFDEARVFASTECNLHEIWILLEIHHCLAPV